VSDKNCQKYFPYKFPVKLLLIAATSIFLSFEGRTHEIKNEISQDFVYPSVGCGTGCRIDQKALSLPEEMKDGWIRVKVEQTHRFYHSVTGEPTDFRSRKYGSKEQRWIFAHCEKELFGDGIKADRSDAFTRDAYWITSLGKKRPNDSTAQANTFSQFQKLCEKITFENKTAIKKLS